MELAPPVQWRIQDLKKGGAVCIGVARVSRDGSTQSQTRVVGIMYYYNR